MDYSREIMEELGRTEGLLHKGLKEINDKGELTAQSLEVLGETLDGIKDLYEIKGTGLDMINQYGYSSRPYMMYRRDGDGDGRYYERRMMYEGNGSSYGYEGNSYRNDSYGYNNRYSGDAYVDELRRKMENAKTEQEREMLRGMIRDHENKR